MDIEKGIPMPKNAYRRTGISATIRKMEHGDSVVIGIGSLTSWRYAANMMGRGTKSQNIDGETVRLWIVDRKNR